MTVAGGKNLNLAQKKEEIQKAAHMDDFAHKQVNTWVSKVSCGLKFITEKYFADNCASYCLDYAGLNPDIVIDQHLARRSGSWEDLSIDLINLTNRRAMHGAACYKLMSLGLMEKRASWTKIIRCEIERALLFC